MTSHTIERRSYSISSNFFVSHQQRASNLGAADGASTLLTDAMGTMPAILGASEEQLASEHQQNLFSNFDNELI